MASRWFILNEWLFSNLASEKDSQQEDQEVLNRKKEQSILFLNALFYELDDGIVVLLGSPWMRKSQRWADRANKGTRQEQALSRYFHGSFMLDRNKCRALRPEVIGELPAKLQELLETNQVDNDDEYLLLTWLSSPVTVECIVTTDTSLQDALAKHCPEIKTRHRDEFLAEYLDTSPAQ